MANITISTTQHMPPIKAMPINNGHMDCSRSQHHDCTNAPQRTYNTTNHQDFKAKAKGQAKKD
jgi:hypothetical protein